MDAQDPAPSLVVAPDPITASVIRLETGGHQGAIEALATSSGGRFLVTGGADRTVRLWRADDLALVRTWRPTLPVRELVVSEDGTRIAASSMRGGPSGGDEIAPPEALRGQAVWRFQGADALVVDPACKVRAVPLDGSAPTVQVDASSVPSEWVSAVGGDAITTALGCDGETSVLHLVGAPSELHPSGRRRRLRVGSSMR